MRIGRARVRGDCAKLDGGRATFQRYHSLRLDRLLPHRHLLATASTFGIGLSECLRSVEARSMSTTAVARRDRCTP